jgi:hypothetical protein
VSGGERGMKDYGKFFKDYKETEWWSYKISYA